MDKFKKNVLSVYLVNLINGFAGIVFIPLALKGLGVEGYALYSMFTLFTSYVVFVELGITKYFIRDLAKEKEEKKQKKIIRLAIGIYIRITIILILLSPIIIYVVPKYLFPVEHNLPIIEIIILFAVLDYLLSIPVSILKTFNTGNELFLKISKFNLISGLSRHLFLIVAVLFFKSIIIIMFIVIIRRLIEIRYAFKYLTPLPQGGWKPLYINGTFTNIISKSILLSAAQISQVVVLTIGTYLVNKYFGLHSLGIYKSSFDLAAKVWFFSNSLGIVLFPRLSSLLKEGKKEEDILKKLIMYNYISWIFYLCFFSVITIILPYIQKVFILEDHVLFILLLIGVSLNAHSNISYEFLHASYRVNETIILNIFSFVLIYYLFYLGLNKFEIHAIGYAWLGSQLIYALIIDFLVFGKRNIKVGVSQSVFQISTFLLAVYFIYKIS